MLLEPPMTFRSEKAEVKARRSKKGTTPNQLRGQAPMRRENESAV
jgi:hypothetical protein